jgi:transposase
LGLLKARGPQRMDSTPVLAAIRVLRRLALVAEMLRAALNDRAPVAPDWLPGLAPRDWDERDGTRSEDSRLPRAKAAREAYAQTVGEDGFRVLDAVDAPEAPEAVRTRPSIATRRRTWQRHDERTAPTSPAPRKRPGPRVRFTADRAVPRAAEGLGSPDDPEARYRHQRETPWTGDLVQGSDTCEPTAPHLMTQVHTTAATVQEARWTAPIPRALVQTDRAPAEPLVDAASISAAWLVQSQAEDGSTLRGPTRPSPGWPAQVEGASTVEHCEVDGAHQRVRCPQGQWSAAWREHGAQMSSRRIGVELAREDCQGGPARAVCTRAQQQGRRVGLPPQAPYEAAQAARAWVGSEEGQPQYPQRAGVEGTRSQGVRGFGRRYARDRGLTKTHRQQVATAAAIKLERRVAWRNERPRAKTRTSRFAALAPACGLPENAPSIYGATRPSQQRPRYRCTRLRSMFSDNNDAERLSPPAESTRSSSARGTALLAKWSRPLPHRVRQQYPTLKRDTEEVLPKLAKSLYRRLIYSSQ